MTPDFLPSDLWQMDLLGEATALGKVVLIDVLLAGDNAVVVAMAAAGVARHHRARVIFWGIGGAVVLRIGLALIATHLLALVGLTLAGGILLLWVTWKMYREIAASAVCEQAALAGHLPDNPDPACAKSFRQALVQIVVADISMSVDNVLAVAGAARDHKLVLMVGLALSIGLMGTAASVIAHLLNRWRWLAQIGLVIVLMVAVEMIWRGTEQIACSGVSPAMCQKGLLGFVSAALP